MNNLQLSLKKKWFEMTKAGIKTEDYREINYYWFRRLVIDPDRKFSCLIGNYLKEYDLEGKNKCVYDIVKSNFFSNKDLKNFDFNTMTLGYPKKGDRDRVIRFKHRGIEIRAGNPEWGAEPNKLYFVIMHGEKA